MQTLEIISINLWDTLISLCNLLLLFLILKKFLYKPVKKVLAERKQAVDLQYSAAEEAQRQALESKEMWSEKMISADKEAEQILKNASVDAQRRGDRIVDKAKEEADGIVQRAKTEARLEVKKAQSGIKQEIINVSAALTEKMLDREINSEDHRELIDSFINEMGEDYDADE